MLNPAEHGRGGLAFHDAKGTDQCGDVAWLGAEMNGALWVRISPTTEPKPQRQMSK